MDRIFFTQIAQVSEIESGKLRDVQIFVNGDPKAVQKVIKALFAMKFAPACDWSKPTKANQGKSLATISFQIRA